MVIKRLLRRRKKVKGELKQAIIVRQDLGMGKGKIAAQVAHASLCAYVKLNKKHPHIAHAWLNRGMKKVVLKVKTKEELYELLKKAESINLVCCLVRDAGKTQVDEGEETALAIGPWYEEEIDMVTQHLKLL